MSASHRDDSPDSLFLPSTRDPHYDNEQASRRRRVETERERTWARHHYLGDGLDFRRPVMSTGEGQGASSDADVGSGGAVVAAPPVIDLTDENEDGGQGMTGGAGDGAVTGASEGPASDGPSRAGVNQRLPRFGRDVIDVEDTEPRQPTHGLPAQRQQDHDQFARLPGANYLALPPRRSDTGRVQYSTLRRPTRPPSPPQEMDDEEIEYMGSRPFASVRDRQPTPGPVGYGMRDVTPFPDVPPIPSALRETIDLTDDADDDVLFVNERRRPGVNMDHPDLNIGNRTYGGEQGFGIARLAGILRETGAAVGGRLAQRVHDFQNNNGPAQLQAQANANLEQTRARRAEIEEQVRANRERRDALRTHDRAQRDRHRRRNGAPTPAPPRHRHLHLHLGVPRVHMDAHGNIPGFQRVGFFGPDGGPQGPGPLDIGMDYNMAAFDLGMRDQRPPTPKYSPPSEPEAGFTRNPGEEEVVVCPNCGDELAVGRAESKQEIWVNKGCGHVSHSIPSTRPGLNFERDVRDC